METILIPVVALGLIGGIFGIILQFASTVFYVEEDPRVTEVTDALPGANCGACGFPGCAGLANAIVEGSAPVTACPVGGQPTAEHVAQIMGVQAGEMEKYVAVVKCNGDCDKAANKFDFVGIEDCRTMNLYYEGNKACSYGCMGGGTCQKVCAFGAIEMVNGIAVINKEKCTACNKCVEVCPKHLIELIPYSAQTVIKCNSHDAGKDVKDYCQVGCIGCRICVKSCPEQTITFDDKLAKIDYSGCVNCGVCVEKCPKKTIHAEYDINKDKNDDKDSINDNNKFNENNKFNVNNSNNKEVEAN